MVMTKGQKNRNQTKNLVPVKNNAPSNKVDKDSGIVTSSSQKEHKGKSANSFDIIQYCEEVRIQISPLDYLKSNLDRLQRLVEHCNNKDGVKFILMLMLIITIKLALVELL